MNRPDRLGAFRADRAPRAIARLGATAVATFVLWSLLSATGGPGSKISIEVIDVLTRRPIAGAVVTVDGISGETGDDGSFRIETAGESIGVRAYGYWRNQRPIEPDVGPLVIGLRPIVPRAVHLSSDGIEDLPTLETLLGLHATTQINAIVIDIKDDHGAISLRDSLIITVKGDGHDDPPSAVHLHKLIERLHQEGMYAIARIVVFKDDVLANAHPEWALKSEDGSAVRENDGIAWTDPRSKSVWGYNLAIAVEAARRGFDEIQFDYIRFPTIGQSVLPSIESSRRRRDAIRGFLAAARTALRPYNVFLAADIFGYASWDPGDTNIGQNLEDIATQVDYVCLMLYPSAFRTGLPGLRMPLDHPDRIVDLSLKRAQQRTGLPAVRFRPWLQAFPDFSFDGRPFKRSEIIAQTQAAESFGSDGWMLWHAHSVYAAEDLP